MIICALVTALISVNGAVAALVPVVVVIAIRVRQPSSQLLMPLAFGAHAGALLALTGSPVNVLVSDAAGDAGVGRFGFFEFALAGIPLLVGTVAITVLIGAPGAAAPQRQDACRPTSAPSPPPSPRTTTSTRHDPLFTRSPGCGRVRRPAAVGARSASRCSRGWSPRAATS